MAAEADEIPNLSLTEKKLFVVVHCGVDFFDSDSDSEFFCRDLWTYKQKRFDFEDSFEESDVENFSQLVYMGELQVYCTV
jgi:hypothetical protein